MARNNAARAADSEEQDPPEGGEPEESLRETLENAFEEVTGAEEPPPGGEPPAGDEPPPGREPQPRERGRFARRETTPPGRETKPPGGETTMPAGGTEPPPGETPEQAAARQRAADEAAGRPPGREPPPNADPTLAPRLWSQQAKAAWKDLPPLVRQEITNREHAMHRELTRQDNERTLARQFDKTFQAFPDVMNSAGVHPVRFVEDVLKVMRVLQFGTPVQRAATLGDIARRNGIDPRLLAGVPPAGAPSPAPGAPGAAPPQPQRFQLPPEVTSAVTEWNEFKRNQAAAAARAQEEMAAQVMTEIQAFSAKPEHRFFEHVRERMETLLASGSSNTLEEAYNTAIYERPDIRAVLEKEAADKVRAEEARKLAAVRARQRGVSVRSRGTGGAPPAPAGDRTLRQELEANFAEARSRV